MKKLSSILEVEEQNDFDEEWVLFSYSITFDEVMEFVFNHYKSGLIKTKYFSQYFQPVFRWIIKYYSIYKKAPKGNMQQLFNFYGKDLPKDISEIIEEYLDRIAEEFILLQEKGVNPKFVTKEIIPRFVKKQEAQIIIDNLQTMIEANKIDKIDSLINGYKTVGFEDEKDPNFGTFKPGSIKTVNNYFDGNGSKDREGYLFKLPGSVGDFIGALERKKLIAITGVEKAGKSRMIQEINYQGVIHHKLKILDINLEMSSEEKSERFWQRCGNYAVDEENSGNVIFPVLDCENNQFGTCEIRSRKLNKRDLLTNWDDDSVSFEERPDWKICQKCRFEISRKNVKRTKRFIPMIWFKETKIRQINENRVKKTINNLLPMGISNYRVKTFPRFSASLDEVVTYIKTYVKKSRFEPDILSIDYPDIMIPIEGKLMDRFNIDYNWKTCALLAQEFNCLVMVADQAVKAARNKRSLDVMDTSESKTKDAHLDMRLTLNCTDYEKELGLQRLGMLFRRKGRLHHSEIMLTQRLETCHPMLDSCWWNHKNIYYPISKRKKD